MSERIYGPAILVGGIGGELHADPIPASHYSVAERMKRSGHKEPLKGEQGFYVMGRGFVDRKEARRIAEAAGQIVNPIAGGGELFSEELWTPTDTHTEMQEEK